MKKLNVAGEINSLQGEIVKGIMKNFEKNFHDS